MTNLGNVTTVTVGAVSGALASVGWWIFSITMPEIVVPDAIVAASVVILTAGLQYIFGGAK